MLFPAVFPVPLSLLVYVSLFSSVQRCVFLLFLAFSNKAVFESAFWLLRSSCLQHTGHDSFVNSDLKRFIQTSSVCTEEVSGDAQQCLHPSVKHGGARGDGAVAESSVLLTLMELSVQQRAVRV